MNVRSTSIKANKSTYMFLSSCVIWQCLLILLLQCLSELRELVMDREAWRAAIHGSQRVGHDWATELNWTMVFPSPGICWATAVFKTCSRYCSYRDEQKRWADPYVIARHAIIKQQTAELLINFNRGYEGDALRAHKVEPQWVWGQDTLAWRRAVFIYYLKQYESEPTWVWASGLVCCRNGINFIQKKRHLKGFRMREK